VDYKKTAYALGFVRDVMERGESLNPSQMDAAKEHLKTLDDAFRDFFQAQWDQSLKQQEMEADLAEARKSASTNGATAFLESGSEGRDLFVRIHRLDGSDYSPARAFQNGVEPQIEMSPIPIPCVLSLGELRAVVKALEENAERLPFQIVE
jgi:hypothetical protein